MKYNGFKIIFITFFSLTLIAWILLFSSCDDSLKFKYPQPVHKNDIGYVPSNILGWYASKEDSFMIYFSEKYIIEYDRKYVDDRDLNNVTSAKSDTLFNLYLDRIRKYRGNYYFSKYDEDEQFWEVAKLDIVGDSLIFYLVWIEDIDMDKLKKITVVESSFDDDQELEYFICNPSKSEWKELYKGNYFSHPYTHFFRIRD